MLAQALLIASSAILTAPIRVTNQFWRGTVGLQRLFERLDHETLALMIGHCIAHDPTAVEIFEAR